VGDDLRRLRLLRRIGTAEALRLLRFALLPATRMGEELFSGEAAPLLLAGNTAHADAPPTAPGSGVFGWLLAMLGQHHGFPSPLAAPGSSPPHWRDGRTVRAPRSAPPHP
jgi:phytoene dehydrogenase-like protein